MKAFQKLGAVRVVPPCSLPGLLGPERLGIRVDLGVGWGWGTMTLFQRALSGWRSGERDLFLRPFKLKVVTGTPYPPENLEQRETSLHRFSVPMRAPTLSGLPRFKLTLLI